MLTLERAITTVIISTSTSGFVGLTGGSDEIIGRAALASAISEIVRPIFYFIAETYLENYQLLFWAF